MAEGNLPPPVTLSVDSSNKNVEDKVDTSDTDYVLSPSSPSLVHSEIPNRKKNP
jgi:hypothetical protein